MISPAELTTALKNKAHELGFALVGACPAVRPGGVSRLLEWIESGYAGTMDYFQDRIEAYGDLNLVHPGTKSLLILGLPYFTEDPRPANSGEGSISRYAWGTDYHEIIREKLKTLKATYAELTGGGRARGVVDSAPLLEREFAQIAGLGWIGKNSLLLNRGMGSWFFLAAFLVDQELVHDEPFESDHCGTCRACLDACPTQAFPSPYVLDATKCISYLTIELREAVPLALRKGLGDWVFGCDVCQHVCPWNHHDPPKGEDRLHPRGQSNPVPLIPLFDLDEGAFRQRFMDTPLWRARRRGILRNAAIVLGNQRCAEAGEALSRGLSDDDPIIRGACAWALGEIGTESARQMLEARMAIEPEPAVQTEIALALSRMAKA